MEVPTQAELRVVELRQKLNLYMQILQIRDLFKDNGGDSGQAVKFTQKQNFKSSNNTTGHTTKRTTDKN